MQNLPKINLKDRRIISELDMDARIPMTKLAKKVGMSRQVVEYRIKRMMSNNVLFGSIAVFDTAVVDYEWFRILFRLLNVTQEQKDEFISYLKAHDNVFWLGEVGGSWDIAVNFICRDQFYLNKEFEKIIARFGNFIKDYEILIYMDVYDLKRGYILENKEQRKFLYHKMAYNKDVKLDKLDKSIIKELTIDASIPYLELGQKLNVSGNTIRNRVNEMMKNKVLLGFRMFINPSMLGYKSHMLFLSITNLDLEKEKLLYEYLKTIPNITFIVKHIGKWRIGMEIETRDEEEFHKIFVDIRGKFSTIINDFESFPLFRDHKINYFPKGALD